MLNDGQVIQGYRVKLPPINNDGSYGIAFEAHRGLERVAIKSCKSIFDTWQTDSIRKEYAALERLGTHPNIIKLIGSLHDDGNYLCYIMEYADSDLKKLIALNTLSTTDKLGIFKQVCNGLEFAHSHSIAHRDLHNGNVLIMQDGTGRHAKLADFGLAKDFLTTTVSSTAFRVWGELVRPPESVFRVAGTASQNEYFLGDIYALGLLLNVLFAPIEEYFKDMRFNGVTGTMAYLGARRVYDYQNYLIQDGLTETDRLSLYEDWAQQSKSLDLLDVTYATGDTGQGAKLTEIIRKAAHPERQSRYQTIQELVHDLEGI